MNICKKLAFLIFLLAICIPVQADSIDSNLLRSLGDVGYFKFDSKTLKRSFHIFVDLPDDYAHTDNTYPTIYLLDGDSTFPLMASYHNYLRGGEETPKAILVGISYGAESFEEGNMRSTDYTAEAKEREHWGGALAFQQMLKSELTPFIELFYRSESTRRVLFGHSLGGQFVLYTALTQPDLFHGYIASNPALHRNLPFFLEPHSEKTEKTESRIYVSSGELDDKRFREPALEWIKFWENRETKPWALKTQTLEGQTHFSAAPESFRQGLKWVFPEEKPKP